MLDSYDPMDCSQPDSSVHGTFRQEYWRELPFPPLGDLPDPGTETASPELAGRFFTTVPTWEPMPGMEETLSKYVVDEWLSKDSYV